MEYPFIYRSTRRDKFKKIAVRYSEAEPIEFVLAHQGLVDWVWIDTNTILPLDQEIYKQLASFKLALVSPDRWGRPADIETYKNFMASHDIKIDLVMVEKSLIAKWQAKG